MSARDRVRLLAQDALARGEPLTWFEDLYSEALTAGFSVIPWADLRPNPNLTQWLDQGPVAMGRAPALVVGCGLGDDAEELSRRGFRVTAFDLSATAIALAKERFSDSAVRYQAADLLKPPTCWGGAFDLVLESYTLQSLPLTLRAAAIRQLAAFVAPAGTLIVIARGRDDEEPARELPWLLAPSEFGPLQSLGLRQVEFEDYLDDEDPPVRRFRAVYRKPAAASG